MDSKKQEIEKAAYGYVYTRTWVPPFDLDCMWEESKHAFVEGALWALVHYQDKDVAKAKELAEKALNYLERPVFSTEGDTYTAFKNRLEHAKEIFKKIKDLP